MTKIEHANITVPSIDSAIKFLQLVAPDFIVRADNTPENSYRWAHVGNDEFYFALQEHHLDSVPKKQLKAYKNYGVNHICLVVNNIDEIEQKLIKGEYQRSISTPNEKFRKRLYFFDHAGFEWELIEYLSDKSDEKYLYE